ncbi:I78 family peptidase inhibitor [Allopontixanthobacter sp.]|uniref:I78 family peptidase inhibitor n=1 Tax=Allopontixanthobacter sp. TaxID=2906452 RepID=UPI002ABB0985|nr:I78 family peptidase inhibitor [Allopontixanthobacter sp.]MDZ4307972.1 I78 family peptidase inhibitor [Allopontixanthobacter sp.]
MTTIFRKFSRICLLPLPAFALLAACGGAAEQSETAEDYAARINGTGQSASATGPAPQGSPAVSTPLPGAAPGPMEPRTPTDPSASSCGATVAAEFLGQPDSAQVRQAITEKAEPRGGIRYIRPGEMYTQDFNNNRLNVMLDAGGVIRDFRCG